MTRKDVVSIFAMSFGLLAEPADAAGLAFDTSNQPALENSGAARVQSGSKNGLSWFAQSKVVGATPTSDVLPPRNTIGGGDPIFKPSANKSGVVSLIMEYEGGAAFICSGSLLGDRRSIATAAHCVSNGFGTPAPLRTTAYFYNGEPDQRTPFNPGVVSLRASDIYVNEGYTGEVIDQNDIAIIRLGAMAPKSALSYDLFTGPIKGQAFNVAGYGARSTIGGAFGTGTDADGNLITGRTGFLREGDNIYDYAWGDPLFQGFFTDRDTTGEFAGQNFFGFADVEFSYVSDFDNGLAAQSKSTRIANALGLGPIGTNNFADLGLGEREVGIAGGDSGGPGFVDGKLASINSYGLSFGTGFGDIRAGLNNSFGEFSGYVPVFIHQAFIRSSMVPEPGSWTMLIAGFGLVGASLRRQRRVATS